MSTNKYDIDGQSKIATWPPKPDVLTLYIAESMTYVIKILTENLGFSTIFDHGEPEETVFRQLRQRVTTGNIDVFGTNLAILDRTILSQVTLLRFH